MIEICYKYGMKPLPFESIQRRYLKIKNDLTERTRRRWAAAEALELGHGGVSAVSRATKLTPRTIRHGISEIASQGDGSGDDALPEGKQRKPGGGRKKLSAKQPGLLDALEKLVEPYTSGDPMGPLRWTCKSTANLSEALQKQGFAASASSVRAMLKEQS